MSTEVPEFDGHPDDDPAVEVDPLDEEVEEDHDTEPDLENGIDEELGDGAPDPGLDPILDEDYSETDHVAPDTNDWYEGDEQS